MKDLDKTLKSVEQARRRKKELKALIEVLFEEYKLVKMEIKLHQERIEKLMSAREYSAFLDTVKLDNSLVFPIFSPEKKNAEKE